MVSVMSIVLYACDARREVDDGLTTDKTCPELARLASVASFAPWPSPHDSQVFTSLVAYFVNSEDIDFRDACKAMADWCEGHMAKIRVEVCRSAMHRRHELCITATRTRIVLTPPPAQETAATVRTGTRRITLRRD